MSIVQQTALALHNQLKSREISCEQVTQAFVDQINASDSDVGAFLGFDPQFALDQAEAVDKQNSGSELAGLPVAIKDVICVKDRVTSCASKMLKEFVAPYDATVVDNLKKANSVILGKTNMDEFAMGSSTENSSIQPTKNPWNLDCVPGGSSGGAAACIAARMAPLSLGSDTGGSVRQPAAFCGVTGLKPTYGRISRYGLVAFASSLDQIGVLAHDAKDAALLLNYCAGHDAKDSTSASTDKEDFLENIESSIEGLRIGIPAEYFSNDALDPEIRSAFEETKVALEKLGATCVDLSLPMTTYGVATYYLVASCEASGNLARYDGAHYGFRAADENQDATENELLRMYRQTR